MGAPEGSTEIRVYPRACGGTAYSASVSVAQSGLSPRLRGNPPAVSSCVVPLRSIPAPAGEPIR